MAEGVQAPATGLRVLCIGAFQGSKPAQDKKGNPNGSYCEFAWFGGHQSARFDAAQVAKLIPGRVYELETDVREFKGDKSIGFNWKLNGSWTDGKFTDVSKL